MLYSNFGIDKINIQLTLLFFNELAQEAFC